MNVLKAAILEAAEDGNLDGFVPRERRFGSAEQLERLGQG